MSLKPGTVAHMWNVSPQEAEIGGLGLKASLSCTVRPCPLPQNIVWYHLPETQTQTQTEW